MKRTNRQGVKRSRAAHKRQGTASRKVGKAMREMKAGKLRSGGSGKRVTSRKQAIAIGLSQARNEGARVPKPSQRKQR